MSRLVGLDADLSLDGAAGGAFEAVIGETWWTPRGPLGGYVMALVLKSMTFAVDDDERQVRSFSTHFLRPPQAGPVTVMPQVERQGRSLTSVSARLEQDGKLLALALAAFSRPWEGPTFDDAPMPGVAPPEGRQPPPQLSTSTKRPPFTDLLTMQWRFGDAPFSGSDQGITGGWLGLRENREIDALAVTLLADAWFPAPWPRLKELAPAPTIDLHVHFRAALPRPDGLLLGRFTNRVTRDGFFDEDGELWDESGTLIAQSRQLGLLIGA